MHTDPILILWACGAATVVAANLIAWTAFVIHNRARRREDALWDAIADLEDTVSMMAADIRANAHECDVDRQRLKKLENPAPRRARHRFEESPVGRQMLALPAARSVRDAIDPAWNGGTSTYDAVMAKFDRIEDTSALWIPPVERAAVVLHGQDETTEIPRITGEIVTGELEVVR